MAAANVVVDHPGGSMKAKGNASTGAGVTDDEDAQLIVQARGGWRLARG